MEKPAESVSFAVFLKRYRHAADLTQEKLAERAGYSTVYLSKLERGERQHIQRAYLQLAQQHHPDHGGSHHALVALNAAYQLALAYAQANTAS